MSGLLALAELGLAAAAGARLANGSQPACHWSSLSAMTLKTRLGMLKSVAPRGWRRRLAATALATLMAGGALAAFAAQPSAPEQLAQEAAGVVGSGDALALRLVQNGQARTLKLGEVYEQGWRLNALTPTLATLTRDGERREIGLNPTGALALALPAGPRSQVDLAGAEAERVARAIELGMWDGKTPNPGLTLAETRRYYSLKIKASDGMVAFIDEMDQRSRRAGTGPVRVQYSSADSLAAAGADAPEYAALLNKEMVAKDALAVEAFRRWGPVQIQQGPEPPGLNFFAKQQADYPGSAWIWSDGPVAGGPDLFTMRLPNPIEGRLYPTSVSPIKAKILYAPPGADPDDPYVYVEGPLPPP